MRGAARPCTPGMTDNINAQMGDEEIDEELKALLEGAPHLITHKVVHQRISQSPMETRGVVATRDGTEELTLYITCQSPHLWRAGYRWRWACRRPRSA
jgi:carbon-monoxide dehydrogenase large subunit